MVFKKFLNTFLKIYLFKTAGKGRRKGGREVSMCGCLSRTPHWGHDLACKPGMCPDRELNWQPFGLQAGVQSTEPHQPADHAILKLITKCLIISLNIFKECNLDHIVNISILK